MIIQTYNPDHYSILKAKDHDYIGFYHEECQFRRALDYPPFSRLINFRLIGNSEKKTKAMAEEMGGLGRHLLKRKYSRSLEILGPSEEPITKMRGKFRWQMLLKGRSSRLLHQFSQELIAHMEPQMRGKGVHLDVDVDPLFIL